MFEALSLIKLHCPSAICKFRTDAYTFMTSPLGRDLDGAAHPAPSQYLHIMRSDTSKITLALADMGMIAG